VTFLIDAQLPPALVSWLIQQGHTAQHLDDLGVRNADDIVIRNYASESGAIVITKMKTSRNAPLARQLVQ